MKNSEVTGTGGVVTKSYTYDALGNLKTKTGLGTYVYGMSGGPHAVSSVDDGQGNVTTYQYDLNGNLISDSSGRTIAWSPFDKPTQITNLLSTLNFTYGTDRARIIQTDNSGKTVHYVGSLYERETTPSGTSHTHYIVAGGTTTAIVKTDNTLNTETRYLHRDHLDSISVITDENGNTVEQLSYDPHGRRRHNTDWADMGTVVPGSVTDRGYTGHEHLDSVGLIHMNGRVQDPVLGRFISADPFIPDPTDLQSFNRYTYVLNKPLSFTDPSGFFEQAVWQKELGHPGGGNLGNGGINLDIDTLNALLDVFYGFYGEFSSEISQGNVANSSSQDYDSGFNPSGIPSTSSGQIWYSQNGPELAANDDGISTIDQRRTGGRPKSLDRLYNSKERDTTFYEDLKSFGEGMFSYPRGIIRSWLNSARHGGAFGETDRLAAEREADQLNRIIELAINNEGVRSKLVDAGINYIENNKAKVAGRLIAQNGFSLLLRFKFGKPGLALGLSLYTSSIYGDIRDIIAKGNHDPKSLVKAILSGDTGE